MKPPMMHAELARMRSEELRREAQRYPRAGRRRESRNPDRAIRFR
ncbi:MAG TPA: hypothetical protein VGH10_12105 [Actinomycetota bacterium]|jgi:hypothetical protein